MKKISTAFVITLLSACAAQDEAITQDTEQAVRDFIAVRQLAETDKMRTSNNDRWEEIDQNFIIYSVRREVFLVEFARRCHELDEYPVVPDVRNSGNTIRSRFDTIRGCRIARIFPLTEDEVAELEGKPK